MALKLYALADVTVTTAGTRVQLSSTSIIASSVTIQAHPANSTALIYVGDITVAAARGNSLSAASAAAVICDHSGRPGSEELNLSDIYIDSDTNGSKVKVTYLARK